MMEAKLLSCPMCGGEASPNGVIRRSSSPDLRWLDGTECLEAFYCNCVSCGLSNGGVAGGYQTREEAIKHWDSRPLDSRIAGLLVAAQNIAKRAHDSREEARKDREELLEQIKVLREALEKLAGTEKFYSSDSYFSDAGDALIYCTVCGTETRIGVNGSHDVGCCVGEAWAALASTAPEKKEGK